MWVAVLGHPCLGWVTVIGRVVAVEDLGCVGGSGGLVLVIVSQP